MSDNSLGKLIKYHKGRPPLKDVRVADVVPVLTPDYMRNGVPTEFTPRLPGQLIMNGTELILLWDGSNAGEFFRARPGSLGSTMVTFEFNRDDLNSDYLYYELKRFEPTLKAKTAGSGIPHVDKEVLLSHEIRKPELSQQLKIAEVLATVDRALTQIHALLIKQKRIKAGLMQDLLTRGIDASGNLRDPRTHAFKDSPLGPIPVEWEVATVGEIVQRSHGTIQTGPFGSQLHAHEYTSDGVPVFMPQNIMPDGQLDYQNAARITPDRAKLLSRHFVKPNDLLFARRGDLSRCAPIVAGDEGLCGTGCLLTRIPKREIDCRWLAVVYREENCQRQVVVQAVGSTMANLNTSIIGSLQIARPSVAEQERLMSVIDKVEQTRLVLNEQQVKMQLLKSGLMQDLLTGQISVLPLLDESK